MTVEMTQPFVWPKALDKETKEEWDSEYTRAQAQDQKSRDAELMVSRLQGRLKLKSQSKPSTDRTSLRQQAEDLLSGKVKWTRTSSPDDAAR
jgi:predicted FMN-binding regulatory protein PaiB